MPKVYTPKHHIKLQRLEETMMRYKPYLIFVVTVYAVSAFKTLCLAANLSETDHASEYVLFKDGVGAAKLYPSIDGTIEPVPFAKPVAVSARTVGLSKLFYAVVPGTTFRDTRYPSVWR